MVPQLMTIMTYNEIVTNPAPITVEIVLLVEIVAQSDCIALFREIFGYWVKNICSVQPLDYPAEYFSLVLLMGLI